MLFDAFFLISKFEEFRKDSSYSDIRLGHPQKFENFAYWSHPLFFLLNSATANVKI